MSGRIAIEPLSPADRKGFVGTRRIVDGFDAGTSPGRVVCRGAVTTADQMADALTAALRGAAVLVTVDRALRDRLLDDAARVGIDVPDATSVVEAPEWVRLLESLGDGLSIARAAQHCNMSQRTAYRRLDEAKRALGAPSTTAAVAMWAAGHRPFVGE